MGLWWEGLVLMSVVVDGGGGDAVEMVMVVVGRVDVDVSGGGWFLR